MERAADSFESCVARLTAGRRLSADFVERTFSVLVGLNEEAPSAEFALCVLKGERLAGPDGQPLPAGWQALLDAMGVNRSVDVVRRCVTFAAAPPQPAPLLQFLVCVKGELLRRCMRLPADAPAHQLTAAAAQLVRRELRELHTLHSRRDARAVARLPSTVRMVVHRAPTELVIKV
ncbi:uncharacterized protein LOC119094169 [Pollicipes pollicipes]|uniref:uncharacterized protein LOC119094169 n=1 Tax=Pollicipes pollicipes TaxID=41117 RepID=UPI0018856CC0|nr:uncharacterized protein LOC119094169 [Pollicipes pollicipes]